MALKMETETGEVCAEYQRRGLPALQEDGKLLVRTGVEITAVQMSAPLGGRVLEDLRIRMIAGPVLARPKARHFAERWTVLCQPDRWPREDAEAEMYRAGANICVSGTPLVLPRDMSRTPGQAWWIQPPGHPLPPLSAVVAVTRMVARQQNVA